MILLGSTSGSWVQLMTKTLQSPYSSDTQGCLEGVPEHGAWRRDALTAGFFPDSLRVPSVGGCTSGYCCRGDSDVAGFVIPAQDPGFCISGPF